VGGKKEKINLFRKSERSDPASGKGGGRRDSSERAVERREGLGTEGEDKGGKSLSVASINRATVDIWRKKMSLPQIKRVRA